MPIPIRKRFGRRAAALRQATGLRQIDIAAEAGISRQHLSEIETGRTEICLDTIEKLAKALRVEPWEMLR